MGSCLLVVPAYLLISTTAFAGGGSQHVLGTMTTINNNHIEVAIPKGR